MRTFSERPPYEQCTASQSVRAAQRRGTRLQRGGVPNVWRGMRASGTRQHAQHLTCESESFAHGHKHDTARERNCSALQRTHSGDTCRSGQRAAEPPLPCINHQEVLKWQWKEDLYQLTVRTCFRSSKNGCIRIMIFLPVR